jgi:hypothetical protein
MKRIAFGMVFCLGTVASLAADDRGETGVRCLETEAAILVKVGGKPVLQYHKRPRESPEGIDPIYRRSGHIHPVFTPDGHELTGDFPADHPHQHGLFFAWRMAEFEGREISFWDQLSRTGRVSHSEVVSTANGADSAKFIVRQSLEDLTPPGGPRPILTETWTVTVYNRGADVFVFDIESEQRCAGESPVTIPQYSYGGLAVRGNEQWFHPQAQTAYNEWERQLRTDPAAPRPALEVMRHDFLTSEGKHQYEGNHSRPRWVDLHGPIDGRMAGLAILCHPGNFRAPQPVRLHPSKPYFCFSPMVESGFEIDPGRPFASRYRFLVHRGTPQPSKIEAEWKRFAAQ